MRRDEEEILNVYSREVAKRYYDFRKKGVFLNDYLVTPSLRSLLRGNISEKKVLDVGCGFGEDMKWCLENGAKSIVGVEINKEFIEIARRDVLLDDVEIINSSVYDIGDMGEKFDVIYANMVFDQISDLRIVFDVLSSLLNKNGRLVFSVVHPLVSATKDYSKTFDNYFTRGKNYFNPKSHGCSLPCYARNFEDYSKLFYDAGFVIERMLEPSPLESSRKRFFSDYKKYNKLPLVVVFSLVKNGNE